MDNIASDLDRRRWRNEYGEVVVVEGEFNRSCEKGKNGKVREGERRRWRRREERRMIENENEFKTLN